MNATESEIKRQVAKHKNLVQDRKVAPSDIVETRITRAQPFLENSTVCTMSYANFLLDLLPAMFLVGVGSFFLDEAGQFFGLCFVRLNSAA